MKTRTAAVLLAATLSAAMVPSAHAEVVTGNDAGLSVDGIQAGRSVQLTIHKAAPNPFNDVPPGELPPGGVAGATFTLERLGGYSLGDPLVWDSFRTLSVEDTESAEVLDRFSAVTDTDGNAVFSDLPQGLYRVRETPPADPSKEFRISAPFLITLPVADAEGSSWAYEVTITPKNKPHEPIPGSSGSSSGGIIPIPVPIPVPGPGGSSSGSTDTSSDGPSSTTEPGGGPAVDETGPSKGIASYLPNTGADVLAISLIGILSMVLGFFLLRRRRTSGE
ncbi:pilin N-terminal domain-containing protein [Corynebacterium meridianum]|uniref:LPXTG cell wall anchor domain-containing protein n=1 Tax=Corynebacterium meridianum TaxID=2765363 RepID=A0A934I9Q0_9CORY|nr:pilin N-terminal domain-containing protein [Corynebacterium meridianum]MBI8989883.1 LPXTG cell wall anchor domain-containing protein [Corynebacterium meridianum]